MTSRLTLIFCLFYFVMVQAQVGSLDAGFSGDGKLTTPVNGGTDIAYGVVVQGNNRIIAVGLTRTGGNDNFAIVRYLEDGTLDTSFSNDGKVDIDFEGGNDEARDVLLLPCLLYTSDAADERSSVDLGGRRIIKKKKTQ